MRKMTFAKKLSWLLMFYIFFISCEDKFEKHYKIPDSIKGNVWETLEEAGDYKMFLQAAELSDFKNVLTGKSIVTAMVPNDKAFEEYLQKKGKSSINDFTSTELQVLVGFHLMYYTFDKERLINFRPNEGDDITEEEANYNAGFYYKHRTRSKDPISYETYVDELGEHTVAVYHFERMLPVFSYRMFQTKQIDAKTNYEYFYPNSTWTGNNGFNVSNASVREYEIVADNGYVYYIDQVLDPLETVYTELYNRKEKYSHFYELYEQYAIYDDDAELTYDYGNGETLFLHEYQNNMPKIAVEWPVLDYKDISTLSFSAANVFAPSNDAFDNFFEEYWKPGGYESLEEVDPIALSYILLNHVYTGSVVFPDEIVRGDIISNYQTPINFDVEKVTDKSICVNGAFYGLDEMKVPALFTSVSGAAFQFREYSNFLYMLDRSSLILAFGSAEAQFTAVIPSNEQMLLSDVWKDPVSNTLVTFGDEGEEPLSNSDMTTYVNMHIANFSHDLKATGKQVIKTNQTSNYWYVKDGKLTTSQLFNSKINRGASYDPFFEVEEIFYNGGSWSNGKIYKYDQSIGLFETNASGLSYMLAVYQSGYTFSMFSSLLRSAGLANAVNGTLSFNNYFVFIPSNEAITNAINAGRIPGVVADAGETDGYAVTNASALAEYLRYYFVSIDLSGMSDYPYVGSGTNREFTTFADGYRASLWIIDDGSRISISNSNRSQTVYVDDIYDQFPIAYRDGGFHIIEDVIEYVNN